HILDLPSGVQIEQGREAAGADKASHPFVGVTPTLVRTPAELSQVLRPVRVAVQDPVNALACQILAELVSTIEFYQRSHTRSSRAMTEPREPNTRATVSLVETISLSKGLIALLVLNKTSFRQPVNPRLLPLAARVGGARRLHPLERRMIDLFLI